MASRSSFPAAALSPPSTTVFRSGLSAADALGHSVDAGVFCLEKLPEPERRVGRADLIGMLHAAHRDDNDRDDNDGDQLAAAIFHLQRPVRVIARAYRRAASDPRNAICRRRIAREFDELTG